MDMTETTIDSQTIPSDTPSDDPVIPIEGISGQDRRLRQAELHPMLQNNWSELGRLKSRANSNTRGTVASLVLLILLLLALIVTSTATGYLLSRNRSNTQIAQAALTNADTRIAHLEQAHADQINALRKQLEDAHADLRGQRLRNDLLNEQITHILRQQSDLGWLDTLTLTPEEESPPPVEQPTRQPLSSIPPR